MNERLRQQTNPEPFAFLAGGGEMVQRTRDFDWSRNSLGPIEGWPQSLKIAVSIMLGSRYAMWLGWGPELTFFYNDAYARMTLGPRHPWALGRSVRDVWSEIWHDIGPRAESVVRTGQATWDEGLLLFLERNGFPEETYHTFSYSPIPDEHGSVGGMLCVVTEDTERTIGERRLRSLRELAARTADQAKSVEDACESAVKTLADSSIDLPFVLIYLLDETAQKARLTGATGLVPGSPEAPFEIDSSASESSILPWPLAEVAMTGRPVIVNDLSARFGALPCGKWSEPARSAIVLPLLKSGRVEVFGFVVAGLSPRLIFSDSYRGYLELMAGHIAIAIANAAAYEQERQRAEVLAELDRAKTAFFSNVSHEFRTPLTLMLGPVEDMLAHGRAELSAADREGLDVVKRNGLRLLRLVNTLLDFSRIEAGRVRAVFQSTDLAAFTTELASMFRSACERAGIRLTVDCEPLGEPVFIDREMWEKIVLNLLSNAFKFTFDGEIVVALRRTQTTAELRVRDTGTGVPAEEMPRLFERFHRIENARGRTHEGSGIGLALVQELVKLHGGSITAESVVGKGTTFQISLPLGSGHLPSGQIEENAGAAATGDGASPYVEEALRWLPDEGSPELPTYHEALAIARGPAEQAESDTRPRVLVADDNADMRQYIVRLLAEHYRIEAAPDGEAAFAAVRGQPPDLVLTDVMMPKLDGFGLLRKLRGDPRTSQIPVILLSARAGEESRVDGMEAGADDYIVKPFSARELLARVTAHLQMSRMRRESEQAIRQSEERFRVLFNTMSEGFAIIEIIFDEEGRARDFRHLEVNPAFERHTGLKRPDILGRTALELFPDAEQLWFERFGGIAKTGIPDHFQARFGPLDRWFEVSAYRTGPKQIATVFFDVTEQKRAELATYRQSEQLRQLARVATKLNASSEVTSITRIVIEEARGLIGSHQAVAGFTTDQNWGQAINTVSLSEKYAQFRDYEERPDGSGIYSLVCRANKPLRLTQAELEQHPAYKWFGIHAPHHPPLRGWLAAPLVGQSGQNFGLIQISDKYEGDFTEEDEAILVQLAQMASVAIENAHLVQDLKDADRRKDEFLATLAHELRNPLAPLRNGLQVMRLAKSNAETVEEARGMMERQLGQMVRLIDDLLDLSRITQGKVELRKERVELSKAIQQAVETSRPAIEQAGHDLTLTVPSAPIFVDADLTRLSQVFANILNNAAKYTERGGRVWLSMERREGNALIRIRDSGVGIPAPMLPRVFDMFTQVDRSLEKSQGGLGIGLSLVKWLVEMHGGSVEARSDGQGLGSEFIVRLPVAPAVVAEQRSSDGDGNGASATRRRRILVVDDNRDAAMSLAMILRIMGNVTRTAHDGLEALEAAATFLPDLVLLDIGMPRLNGYDTARRMREQTWGKGVTLVALTGWGQEDDKQKAKEAGFDFHMVKPIESAALEKFLAENQPL